MDRQTIMGDDARTCPPLPISGVAASTGRGASSQAEIDHKFSGVGKRVEAGRLDTTTGSLKFEARASSLISRASIRASTATTVIFNEYSLFVSFAVIRAICLYVRNNIFKRGD